RSADGSTGWTNIAGATAGTYTYTSADVGNYVRIEVTATNACVSGCGSTSADSAASGRVTGDAPVNTAVPTISGAANDGTLVTSTAGTWTGTPTINFTYQWQRSANGTSGWANIGGATTSTYTFTSADVDQYVRVAVTGTNAC